MDITEKIIKDFWIEMSIREISTQSKFANLAYENIQNKAQSGDIIFSSIHSFLSHCAMISKLLKALDENDVPVISKVLNLPESSLIYIHKRKFRNHLEHYDQDLKKWIRKFGPNSAIGTYNILPKASLSKHIILISNYDPILNIATFVDEDIVLEPLCQEVLKVKALADDWVTKMESEKKRRT